MSATDQGPLYIWFRILKLHGMTIISLYWWFIKKTHKITRLMHVVARIYFQTRKSVFTNDNKIYKNSLFCVCKRVTKLRSKEWVLCNHCSLLSTTKLHCLGNLNAWRRPHDKVFNPNHTAASREPQSRPANAALRTMKFINKHQWF